MSGGYYDKSLSGERLRRCYEIAPPRVQQYLAAEIEFARKFIRPADAVLELGCGYGRVLRSLVGQTVRLVGIDTAKSSLALARTLLPDQASCELVEMDAVNLTFENNSFDRVLCLQNGISAFHVDPQKLISEALRVTRSGGTLVFSSYSATFWTYRLQWFELQAREGLVGEIDYDATGDGVIVCKDGFTATTVGTDEFRRLALAFDIDSHVQVIDDSSVFCVLSKR
jgi:2-polyprenyl-6-hydroxyphenyl methylase/3-demethylubiquinone-9 3-methyltransferase